MFARMCHKASPVLHNFKALVLGQVPFPEHHLLCPLLIHSPKGIYTAQRTLCFSSAHDALMSFPKGMHIPGHMHGLEFAEDAPASDSFYLSERLKTAR